MCTNVTKRDLTYGRQLKRLLALVFSACFLRPLDDVGGAPGAARTAVNIRALSDLPERASGVNDLPVACRAYDIRENRIYSCLKM